MNLRFDHEAVQRQRATSGLSRDDLAERTGLTYEAIRLIEDGKRQPRYPTALKIAAALDLDVSQLWLERAA